MPSPVHRLLRHLKMTPFAAALMERLPPSLSEMLRELSDESEPPTEVKRAEAAPTQIRAAAFAIGAVREGGRVRAVNVLRGAIDGGNVRGVNLLVGDVLHGDLRGINVIVGDVHGGTLRDIHLIVGDVWGGRLADCYAVIGDIHGGEGAVSRVLGSVHHDGIVIEKRIEP